MLLQPLPMLQPLSIRLDENDLLIEENRARTVTRKQILLPHLSHLHIRPPISPARGILLYPLLTALLAPLTASSYLHRSRLPRISIAHGFYRRSISCSIPRYVSRFKLLKLATGLDRFNVAVQAPEARRERRSASDGGK
ncbi:hypothetical protein Bca101_058566 [Brassica carinata]